MSYSSDRDEPNTATWLGRVGVVKLCVSLLPRKCYNTGQSLWLKYAYRTTQMITGPGDPVFVHRWYSSKEFLMLRIKYGNFGSMV